MDIMNLKNYFEERKGLGVLSTADSNGNVNAAVYSRPHFLEEGSLTFIMRDRLTRHNLASNPNAVFLFVENGDGYKGKRLYLKKLKEELDPERRRRTQIPGLFQPGESVAPDRRGPGLDGRASQSPGTDDPGCRSNRPGGSFTRPG